MKKLLLLIVCMIIPFIGRSQQEYYVSKSRFYLSSDSSLSVSGKSDNGATFGYGKAASKYHKRNNLICYETATFSISENRDSLSKKISFSLHNINVVKKNGSYYKYSVYNDNGKQTWCKDIYWGITISFEKTDGTAGSISFWHNEKCPVFGRDYNCSTCIRNSFGHDSGWNRRYSIIEHFDMEIYLDANGNCTIEPYTAVWATQKFSGIKTIKSILLTVQKNILTALLRKNMPLSATL